MLYCMQKYSPYRAICNMLVINTVGKFLCCVIFHSLILAESVLALSGFVINWVLCLRDFYLSLQSSARKTKNNTYNNCVITVILDPLISTINFPIRVQRALAPAFCAGLPVLYHRKGVETREDVHRWCPCFVYFGGIFTLIPIV